MSNFYLNSILCLIFYFSGDLVNIGSRQNSKIICQIPAEYIKFIIVAQTEFTKEKIDPQNYEACILDEIDTVSIILKDPNPSGSVFSQKWTQLPYSVVINKKTLKIIKSGYDR